MLHEVRDLKFNADSQRQPCGPAAQRAKEPPRTQRVGTGGKGEAVSEVDLADCQVVSPEGESDRETLVGNEKDRDAHKRKRPMTGRRCSGTGARCSTSP